MSTTAAMAAHQVAQRTNTAPVCMVEPSYYTLELNPEQMEIVQLAVNMLAIDKHPGATNLSIHIAAQKSSQKTVKPRRCSITIAIDGIQADRLADVFTKAMGNGLINGKDARDFNQLREDIFEQIPQCCRGYRCSAKMLNINKPCSPSK